MKRLPFLVVAAGCAATLQAQTVELRLRDAENRAPIVGAIVRLLRNDSVVAQALTSEVGTATLRATAPGRYQVRVDRIGMTGFLTAVFPLETGTTFRAEIPVASTPLALPDLVVQSRSPCDKRSGSELATVLWEEIRKALTANLLTQQDRSVSLLVRHFVRELSTTAKFEREWVYRSALTRGQPFQALPAAQLATVGFVYVERDTTVFAVPDARLLLSDEFVATHCFQAVPGPANRIGLAFDPIPDRKVPDVSGTLWVNRATSELVELEYAYTGLPRDPRRVELGGRVEFQRLPAGSWIVSYWHVRMPVLESFERYRERQATTPISRIAGYVERGGRALTVPPDLAVANRAILAGRVFDSIAATGLPGAIITLTGSSQSVSTGLSGEFLMEVGLAGPTTVTASHPKFMARRGDLTKEIVLSIGDTARVEFSTPSLPTWVRSRCGSPGRRAGVVGLAWRPDSTVEVNAELVATWRTSSAGVKQIFERTDQRGGYAFCDLPPDQPVNIDVMQGRITVASARVQLGWAQFQWLDLRPAPR